MRTLLKIIGLTLAILVSISTSGQTAVLFQESFEDGNFSGRGWYDGPGGTITTTEHVSGSTASFQCRFLAGQTGCAGGAPKRHAFTATDSIYISFHIKHSTNWVGSGKPYHPHEFYFLTTENSAFTGPAYSRLTAYVETNGRKPVLSIQDAQNIDETRIGQDLIKVTEQRAVSGCNGTLQDGYDSVSCFPAGAVHWNGKVWKPSADYFQDVPGPYYKNDWHFVEAYFKLNSIVNGIGIADGVLQYWYDGQLIIDRNNIIMRTGQFPNMKFNQLLISPYIGDTSPIDQSFWVDNMTIATSRPTSTPPPSAPSNLTVQ
jgi:hypothetical protein